MAETIPLVPIPEYFEPGINGWMTGSNGVGVKGGRWTTLENYQVLVQQYAALREEVERLKGTQKPKCPDCNSVRMSHCSDPTNCGGVYYPDHMYRKLEQDNANLRAQVERQQRAVTQKELELKIALEGLTRNTRADVIAEVTSQILASRARASQEGSGV